MIGLALVTLVAVIAAGITKSFRGAVDDLWVSGYAITAQNNFDPIPIAAGNAAAQHARRRRRSRTSAAATRSIFGSVHQATAVEPGRRADLPTSTGSTAAATRSSRSSARTARSSTTASRRRTT